MLTQMRLLIRSKPSVANATPSRDLDTVKATLDCTRADVEEEMDRMKVLDSKLSNVASFAGVSLSVSGAVGANVVSANVFPLGFTIALGAVLATAVLLLAIGVTVCFSGLMPKDYRGISLDAASQRVTPTQLRRPATEAIPNLASTYATVVLPQARATNSKKVAATKRAFALVAAGLFGVVLALVLTVVAAAVS
jgi:hypothetical protein